MSGQTNRSTPRERAYRQKLKQWGVKRVDKGRDDITHRPPAALYQGVLHTVGEHEEKAVTKSEIYGTTFQQPHIKDSDSATDHLRHRNTPILLPHDETFDKVIQQICEEPSERSLESFLCKEDIFSNGSTLPHYIAARGRLNSVLIEAIHFSRSHGYPVDTCDKNGFTA